MAILTLTSEQALSVLNGILYYQSMAGSLHLGRGKMLDLPTAFSMGEEDIELSTASAANSCESNRQPIGPFADLTSTLSEITLTVNQAEHILDGAGDFIMDELAYRDEMNSRNTHQDINGLHLNWDEIASAYLILEDFVADNQLTEY